MTLPDERYAAVRGAGNFLRDLAAGKFKRVPHNVRDQARGILRHYPDEYDLMAIERLAPSVMQKKMDDLHRMVYAYEQQQGE